MVGCSVGWSVLNSFMERTVTQIALELGTHNQHQVQMFRTYFSCG